MKVTIFYSWQSDLPNSTNWGFIESVIEKAKKNIKRDETYELELCLDRDTQGVPGSPDIVDTIFEKIRSCDIFVVDVSIVTGDPDKQIIGNHDKKQRLSPNPNVLIELGYAIHCLGWDRIILFCNEFYGTVDKLPFDIQQRRTIRYRLGPDDERAPVRDRLAKTCKTALVDITENLHKRKGKSPDLTLEWTRFDYSINKGKTPPIEQTSERTDILLLARAEPIDDIETTKVAMAKDLRDIEQIDGSIDIKWGSKVKRYTNEYDEFIRKISTEEGKRIYFIDKNRGHAADVALRLYNSGSVPASRIRVEITIPNWLMALKKLPKKKDVPQKPIKPVPTPTDPVHEMFHGNWMQKQIFPDSRMPYIPEPILFPQKQTSGCYIDNGKIVVWVEELPHKHEISFDDDSFYLLAMPDSELGERALVVDFFCLEYEDWEESQIFVNIVAHEEEPEIKD